MIYESKNTEKTAISSHLEIFRKELAHSQSLNDLKEKIHEIIHEMGFSDFLFIRLKRNWKKDSIHGLIHSLPEEFIRLYNNTDMHKNDLLLQYAKENTQPIFSSQIYGHINRASFDIELTRKNRQLLQLYQRFDYFEHYAIPMPAINSNGNVVLILTSNATTDEFKESIKSVMSLSRTLCQAIDDISTKKFNAEFIKDEDNPVKVTPRQIVFLQAFASKDMSITALAKEMSVSSVTAHQHLAAAREALSVNTNIAAILKAAQKGLIEINY